MTHIVEKYKAADSNRQYFQLDRDRLTFELDPKTPGALHIERLLPILGELVTYSVKEITANAISEMPDFKDGLYYTSRYLLDEVMVELVKLLKASKRKGNAFHVKLLKTATLEKIFVSKVSLTLNSIPSLEIEYRVVIERDEKEYVYYLKSSLRRNYFNSCSAVIIDELQRNGMDRDTAIKTRDEIMNGKS